MQFHDDIYTHIGPVGPKNSSLISICLFLLALSADKKHPLLYRTIFRQKKASFCKNVPSKGHICNSCELGCKSCIWLGSIHEIRLSAIYGRLNDCRRNRSKAPWTSGADEAGRARRLAWERPWWEEVNHQVSKPLTTNSHYSYRSLQASLDRVKTKDKTRAQKLLDLELESVQSKEYDPCNVMVRTVQGSDKN